MKVHRIYCGLQSNDLSPDQAAETVGALALEHFPNGHTIYEAEGRWRGANVAYNERTLIVEVWEVEGFDKQPTSAFALAYRDAASQESVVIISQTCEALVW